MSNQYDPRNNAKVKAYYPLNINYLVSAFLRNLEDRSAYAAAETTTGAMILNTFIEFVVGQGLEAQASPENSILKWDEDTLANYVSQAESFFRQYAGSRRIDHYGKLNFYQTQKVAMYNGFVDGDFLLRRSYRNGHHDYEPFFQLLSGKWVRNPMADSVDTKKLAGGVEFDEAGREYRYWIAQVMADLVDSLTSLPVYKYNPKSGWEEYNLVRFGIREANQVRGIPLLTPILDDIFNLEEFKITYRMKAATQALFTGFITSEKDAPAPAVSTTDKIRNLANPSVEKKEEEKKGEVREFSLGTGNIIELNPGEKFEMAESKVPASDYKQYMEAELPQITAGVGLAYEMALQKYNNNYSASRATIAGMEKKFKNYREDLVAGFCNPVWEQVIDWGIRKGYIDAPGYIERDWRYKQAVLAATWIGPSPISIDPLKEVNAHVVAINNGLEPKGNATREMFGMDYEETVDHIRNEQKIDPMPNPAQTDTTPSEEEDNE